MTFVAVLMCEGYSVDQFLMVMSMFEALFCLVLIWGRTNKGVLVASCRNDMTPKKISLGGNTKFLVQMVMKKIIAY